MKGCGDLLLQGVGKKWLEQVLVVVREDWEPCKLWMLGKVGRSNYWCRGAAGGGELAGRSSEDSTARLAEEESLG